MWSVGRVGADTEGVLTVETIARIRRDHFKDGRSIKAIARTRGVSRNTVRKVLRRDETAFRYDRQAPAVYPKLGPFQARLEALLTARLSQSRRERLTLMRMWELLGAEGYAGSYDAVRRYAQRWRRAHGQVETAYIPLTFDPGEAYQFDWSHEIVVLGGVTTTVKVAHLRLCHSRMPFVRAYPRETQEMVFDAHNRAFAFYRGACGRGIYDNMKTAVDAIFVGKARQFRCVPPLTHPQGKKSGTSVLYSQAQTHSLGSGLLPYSITATPEA